MVNENRVVRINNVVKTIKETILLELESLFKKFPNEVITEKDKFMKELYALQNIMLTNIELKEHPLLYTKTGKQRKVGKMLPKEHMMWYVGNQKVIQCSTNPNIKAAYEKLYTTEAVKKAYFIQVKPKKAEKGEAIKGAYMLPIDIDDRETYKSFANISSAVSKKFKQKPTFVTKTTKGWHILLTLNTFYQKNDKLAWKIYQHTAKKVNEEFGGDYHSAGFIMRNPINHEHIFNNSVFTLIDFYSDTEFIDLVKAEFFNRITKYVNKSIDKAVNNTDKAIKNLLTCGIIPMYDLSKVEVGQRNFALYNNLRTLGFRAMKDNITQEEFIEMALIENSKFPYPLPSNEVINTTISVYTFVKNNFNDKFNYVDENYYKELSLFIKSKTMVKIVQNLTNSLIKQDTTIAEILADEGYYNKLAKLAQVDVKTYRKYREDIKTLFILFVSNTEQEKDESIKVDIKSIMLMGYNVNELISTFKEVNFWENTDDYLIWLEKTKKMLIKNNRINGFIIEIHQNSDKFLNLQHMSFGYWTKNRIKIATQNIKNRQKEATLYKKVA